jgi:hypothetical protein
MNDNGSYVLRQGQQQKQHQELSERKRSVVASVVGRAEDRPAHLTLALRSHRVGAPESNEFIAKLELCKKEETATVDSSSSL